MLTIKSSQNSYNVVFVNQFAQLLEHLNAIENSVVVMDQEISQLYPEIKEALALKKPLKIIHATEENKTLAGAEEVLAFLQENKANKNTAVIAIGGGITQDIASFAAHVYYRGIPFIFVPTTLLAMSDSCIGAKCGLNYFGFKNQIGAFHSPKEVMICDLFINSLSDEALYSGYGEIFKLFLIDGAKSYQDLITTLNTQGFKNNKTREYILEALTIKKKFIEEDEFDVGIRRILNFGHTFGHALELATEYQIPHGIAVARGIDLVNFIMYNYSLLSQQDYLQIHEVVERHFNCGFCPAVSAVALLDYVKMDKKIMDDKLNLILLEEPGKLVIKLVSIDSQLKKMVQDYLESNLALYSSHTTQR